MSNVLSPIVARYSLFFTLSMFSSSTISQTKQPTHLVQTLLIEAQQRYQDKATQKLRALIRNASTTSASPSALSRSSAFPSNTNPTELSSPSSFTTHSGTEAPPFPLELPSLPLADKRAGSSTQKSDEHRESASATLVFTLPGQTELFPELSVVTPSGTAADSLDRLDLPRTQAASETVALHPKDNNAALLVQGSQVSKSSIATLLSVTLTMILLSLLQNKKRRLRRKARSLRGSRRHHTSKHHHRDDHKTSSIDRSTNYPYSLSSRTNTPTLMDGMTESAQSLTQSHAYHHYYNQSASFANTTDREPTHFALSHTNDSDRQSNPPRSPAMLNFESNHPSGTSNLYNSKNVGWSLSDGHLPAKQSKDDFVTAWLTQQSSALGTVDQESFEVNHPGWGVSSENIHMPEEPQQFYAPLDLRNKPGSHQHTIIINSGAQREPRQELRASQQTLEHYQGSLQLPQHPPPAQQSPTLFDHHRHQAHRHHWQDQHHYQIQSQHLYRQHHHHVQGAHSRSSHLPEHQGYHHQPYDNWRHEASSSSDDHSHSSQGLRRSLSLTQTFPARLQSSEHLAPALPKLEDLSPAEQVRQEHSMRRRRYQMYHQQQQQHRQQHQPQKHLYRHDQRQYRGMLPNGHHHQVYHGQNVEATSSVYDLGQYSPRQQSSKARTARELAWERHCYYQQQQEEEEALAEQKRKEFQWQEQQEEEQRQQQLRLQPLEQDLVARTGSLNRSLSSSLSPQAAHAFGRSRSKSIAVFRTTKQSDINSRDVEPSSKDITATKSMTSDCPILTAGRRLMRRNEAKELKAASNGKQNPSEPGATNTDNAHDNPEELATLQSVPHPSQESTTSLTRRRTLKNIGPSIRSLARRCSSRFSNRPNSFAGSSSDPIVQFTDGKAVVTGSLSNRTNHRSRSLTPGPDGIVDLQQAESSAVKYCPPASASTLFLPLEATRERVPIHRRVTLFRSKTTRLSPTSNAASDNKNDNAIVSTPVDTIMTTTKTTVTRTKSLSTRPRNSLRLANGRGFDFCSFQTKTSSETTTTITTSDYERIDQSTSELQRALPVNGSHSVSEEEQHEATRRQVIAFLAMGRKERISAKTGQAVPTTATRPTNLAYLSPLALEAQGDLAVAEEKKQEEDPCDRIAFMLVPKSRYEFQPLVAV
ncbi:hypothetical protein BGZ58_011008 [Dissophora ornata]|nr:hypothetical protein BGZ58_011008 [Dissophora ornata]